MNSIIEFMSFEQILKKYEAIETSKGTDKNTSHSYGAIYTELFKNYTYKPIELLEVGFDCGASLLAYADYFTNSLIFGIDIQDHRLEQVKSHPRIKTVIEDALNNKNSFGRYYDIIIEDASHELEHQIKHFIDFGPFVKMNGLYIIEDVAGHNVNNLRTAILPYVFQYKFTLEIKDLRHNKNRFDDILFILKKEE